jgi:hypothetical protein
MFSHEKAQVMLRNKGLANKKNKGFCLEDKS